MKKILFIPLAFIITSDVNAQIKKGTVLLGGDVSYSTSKNSFGDVSSQKVQSGSFGLSIGKAFKENSVFGISLGYVANRQQYQDIYQVDSSSYNSNIYSAGIFYRKYKQLSKSFYFFGQVDAYGFFGNDDNTQSTFFNKNKRSGGSISLSPGIAYQLCKKIQMEASIPSIFNISYATTKWTSNNPQNYPQKSSQFSVYSNLRGQSLGWFSVGFRFIL